MNYWLILLALMIVCHVLGRTINTVRTHRCSYTINKDLAALVEKARQDVDIQDEEDQTWWVNRKTQHGEIIPMP